MAEMLVVLAILVGLTTMAWPTVRRSLDKARLQDAGRQVSVELTRARLAAIGTGSVRQFRFELGGTHFEVAPRAAAEDPLSGLIAPSDPAEQTLQFELSEGVTFAAPDPSASTAATPPEGLDPDALLSEGQWSPPIVFYPNGRSSNARIRLLGQNSLYVEVTLRGLTGNSRVGAIQQGEALP